MKSFVPRKLGLWEAEANGPVRAQHYKLTKCEESEDVRRVSRDHWVPCAKRPEIRLVKQYRMTLRGPADNALDTTVLLLFTPCLGLPVDLPCCLAAWYLYSLRLLSSCS
jgi:hypothetical protein